MQPKKSKKTMYLLAAVGIGALAAVASSMKSSPGTSKDAEAPAPAAGKAPAKKSNSSTPTASSTNAATSTPKVEQHGFTDVLLIAEVWEGEGSAFKQFLNTGERLILTLADKTYVGRYLGLWGNMRKFELKLKDGKKFQYWLHKDDVKIMSAAQRNTYMQTKQGKFMAEEKIKALIKHFYAK